jgi:hypothetical protein
MRQAAIILLAIIFGIGVIYLIVAILPFLIAIAGIVFIWWMIGMCLSGGFTPRPPQRK